MSILDMIKLLILMICLPGSLVVLTRLILNLKRFRPKDIDTKYLSTGEAPSISVCIPVRNEDHAIRDCLERVLSSNYPKMEVIVLDDASVDNTPEIVKIFARDGVRFIKGEPLPEGWIGKNKAADQLIDQASGKYVLFLSADTDIKPDSISRLVAYALRHEVDMIGVMPIRLDSYRLSTIFGTLRYFWSVVFSRPAQPAQTTAAWLIERQALIDSGGFAKYKSTIMPEAKLAEDFAAKNSYRFFMSDKELGFSYEKRWLSQIETSIRTLWPVNVRSNFFLFGALLMTIFMWKTMAISLILDEWSLVDWGLLVTSLVFNLSYLVFTLRAWRGYAILAFFVWPWAVVQEMICLVASFVKHKTNSLVWKGRALTDHID